MKFLFFFNLLYYGEYISEYKDMFLTPDKISYFLALEVNSFELNGFSYD